MGKCFGVILFFICSLCFSENTLPRIAVVQFITNDDVFYKEFIGPIFDHTIRIREMVYESLKQTEKYDVINIQSIDLFFKEQNIPIRLFSSKNYIEKFKMLQIDYLITGTIAAYIFPAKGGTNSCVSLNLFDLTNNKYIYRDYEYFSERKEIPYTIVNTLITRFVTAISDIDKKQNVNRPYKAGDFGPAGGIICYDKGEYSDGWRYIEMATPEVEFKSPWGSYGIDVPGTGTDVGRGKENTILLVKFLNSLGETGTAAQLCDELECNGYDDWFLPSKEELVYITLFMERDYKEHNGYRTWYWSSSQSSSKFVWMKIDGTYRGIYAKNYVASVRAIRYF
jgi:hypothetical protein